MNDKKLLKLRILLISASEFGYKCLSVFQQLPQVEIAGIITSEQETITVQKEKIQNIHSISFDSFAHKHNIPLLKISGAFKNDADVQWVQMRNAGLGLAIGWYQKIPREILNIPTLGIAGIHASKLPLYRGGAPLVWAIINGEKEAGVSLFYLSDKMDEGDLLAQRSFPIGPSDYIDDVYQRMEKISMGMLAETLNSISEGHLESKKQEKLPENTKPVWPMRTPKDGLINWSNPANEIYNFIRAQSKPYPGAYTILGGHKLHIWRSHVEEKDTTQELPGTVLSIKYENGKPIVWIAVGGRTILSVDEMSVDRTDSLNTTMEKLKPGALLTDQ